MRAGASRAALSGSGAALFGRFEAEQLAAEAASNLARYGIARLARPLSRSEYLSRMVE